MISRLLLLPVILLIYILFHVGCGSDEAAKQETEMAEKPATEVGDSPLYSFSLNDIDGNPITLAAYRDKVILLVNVASKCGFTKQYAGLQGLYERYKDRGLVVLGFPANNFGAQEPGTNEQIKLFCTETYDVKFPMFAKISVKGNDIHPLYEYLTHPATNPGFAGDITWNFNKFLFDRQGKCIGRYDSAVEPLSEHLLADINRALETKTN